MVVCGLLTLRFSDPEYLLYAPSTVAISALLISFSVHHLPCATWLNCIPDCCLPSAENPLFRGDPSLLDIDSCILSFERMPMLRAHYASKSPTGIDQVL